MLILKMIMNIVLSSVCQKCFVTGHNFQDHILFYAYDIYSSIVGGFYFLIKFAAMDNMMNILTVYNLHGPQIISLGWIPKNRIQGQRHAHYKNFVLLANWPQGNLLHILLSCAVYNLNEKLMDSIFLSAKRDDNRY